MSEVWKEIKGYRGQYLISDEGRVKSIEQLIVYVRCGRLDTMVKKARILKHCLDKDGYVITSTSGMKTERVHRIVANHFITKISGKNFVNHKNGVKDDNRIENLEWCTAGENTKHSFEKLGRKGECYNRKMVCVFIENRKKYFDSITEASEFLDRTKTSLSWSLKNGKKCAGKRVTYV